MYIDWGDISYLALIFPMLKLIICKLHWAGVVAGGSCSSVAEHWHGKPKALGFTPICSIFLSPVLFALSKVPKGQ